MRNNNKWYLEPTSFYLTKLEYPSLKFKEFNNEIVNLLKINGFIARVSKDTERAIKLLSLNLYLRHAQFGAKGIVNVYKKEDTFKKGNTYRDVFGLAFKSFNSVLKGFEGLGFIKIKIGDIEYKDNKTRIRRPTKICATEKFYNLLNNHLDVESIIISVEALIEIKTKDGDIEKHYLEYNPLFNKNKKLTNQLRLKKFNELSQSTSISVGDHVFSKADVQFKRIYHNDFKTYGRLHCATIQNLPKEIRPYICFNNEPTVEVDIVSSHLLLAYALSGADLTELPPAYELDNIECDKEGSSEAKLNRKILKQCLLMLINTGSVHGCAEALLNWRVEEEGKSESCVDGSAITKIAKALPLFDVANYYRTTSESYECKVIAQSMYDKHEQCIKNWLDNKKSGVKLMHIESEIIFGVVRHFVDKGVYCLPIHDSIRIAESYSKELEEMMVGTIQDHLNIDFHDVSKVVEVEESKEMEALTAGQINEKVLLAYQNKRNV